MNLWLLLSAALTSVVNWTPVNVTQFWVEPNRPVAFTFQTSTNEQVENGTTDAKTVPFEIKTSDGKTFSQGEGKCDGKTLQVETTLPQGFWELTLPETEQAFGIASQPFYCPEDAVEAEASKSRTDLRPRDEFFGIDAASTWLVGDDKAREELIHNARRFGLATYRERTSWSRIEPQEGTFNYDGDNRSELVRELAKKYDLPVLELFHNAPSWAGLIKTYPKDLIKTANSWGTIGNHWNQYWNSIEVWNEPDISFGGDLPADQYVPVLKTVAQEFRRQNIQTPIVGGIIAFFKDGYMDSFAENGGIDACDIFSFHTYCRAFEMESVSLRYLNWLGKYHAEWKPVWITECGRPWKKGTSRPNGEADLESAIDIVEKGVAAKAMGIDAYFPFVYVFYEENDNNFGMSDRYNAPLRSSAGYARSIYLLSGKSCFGSIAIDGAEHSYAFRDRESGEQVVVLYARDRKAGRTITLPENPQFVERVTGERLNPDAQNVVDFSDGFLFVGYGKDVSLKLLEPSEVDKARTVRLGAKVKHGVDPRKDSNVVLRFDYDDEQVLANSDGYTIKDSKANTFKGKVSVYNFDSVAKSLPIKVWARMEKADGLEEVDAAFTNVPQAIDVPARECAAFEFELNLSALSAFDPTTIGFQVGDQESISFRIARVVTQDNIESVASNIVPVNLADVSRWRKNASRSRSYEFKQNLLDSGKWGFDISFEEGDKWAYPVYQLPLEISPEGKSLLIGAEENGEQKKFDMASFKGMVLTVKASSDNPDGVVRVFTHNEKGEYFFTGGGIMKTDGERRTLCVLFKSLSAYGNTPEAFDPARIRAISVGCNSQGENASLEVESFSFFN